MKLIRVGFYFSQVFCLLYTAYPFLVSGDKDGWLEYTKNVDMGGVKRRDC